MNQRRSWSDLKRSVIGAITTPVIDDRGARRGLYRSTRRIFRDDAGTGIPQADFERVLQRLAPDAFRHGPGAQWAMAAACLAGAVLVFALSQGQLRWMAFGLAAVAPLFVFGALTTRRWFVGFDAGEVKAAMTAEGRCASCAYLLSAIPAEADGCTVCPECGAAWRLTETHSVPSPASGSQA